ncbi:hypothetical protein CB1_001533055 [Camelus ferus]|nr:hypothetical protein CB1_001533055 [Camelus ferus]
MDGRCEKALFQDAFFIEVKVISNSSRPFALTISFLTANLLATLTAEWFTLIDVTSSDDSNSTELRNDQKLRFPGSCLMFHIKLL